MDFQTTLQSWHDFYSITGMAAASLVGLLFVGLSLHLRIVVTHEDVKALARVTLTSLGVTLVLALFMVIPETNDPSSTGWDVTGVGVFGVRAPRAPAARRGPEQPPRAQLPAPDAPIRLDRVELCGRHFRWRNLREWPIPGGLQLARRDFSGPARRRAAQLLGPPGDGRRSDHGRTRQSPDPCRTGSKSTR